MEKNFFEWVIFFIQGNGQQFLLGTVTTLFVSLSGTIIGFFLGLGVIMGLVTGVIATRLNLKRNK